jgi:Ala-tRNA(Pro) deacylase
MRELLGVEPGSVTPFAAINDVAGKVAVVLDSAMLSHEILNYHPLVNTMTTSISRSGLVKFLEASGHAPRIEAVSEAGGPHATLAPPP